MLEINKNNLDDVPTIARHRRKIGKKYVVGIYSFKAGGSITEKAHEFKGLLIFYPGHSLKIKKGLCEVKIAEKSEHIDLDEHVVTIVTIPAGTEYILRAITDVEFMIQYEIIG